MIIVSTCFLLCNRNRTSLKQVRLFRDQELERKIISLPLKLSFIFFDLKDYEMKLVQWQFHQVLKRVALFGLCLPLGHIYSSNADQAFIYFHRHRNRYLSVPDYQLSIRQSVDDLDCSMACRRISNCISYNIATSRGLNNLKSCELLSTNSFNSSKNLQESVHFDHLTMEVTWIIYQAVYTCLCTYNYICLYKIHVALSQSVVLKFCFLIFENVFLWRTQSYNSKLYLVVIIM